MTKRKNIYPRLTTLLAQKNTEKWEREGRKQAEGGIPEVSPELATGIVLILSEAWLRLPSMALNLETNWQLDS